MPMTRRERHWNAVSFVATLAVVATTIGAIFGDGPAGPIICSLVILAFAMQRCAVLYGRRTATTAHTRALVLDQVRDALHDGPRWRSWCADTQVDGWVISTDRNAVADYLQATIGTPTQKTEAP